MKRLISILIATAVMIISTSAFSATTQNSKIGFDRCYQSEAPSSSWLKFSTVNSSFALDDCAGFSLSGTGRLIVSGPITTFNFDVPKTGGFWKGRFTIQGGTATGTVIDGATGGVVFVLDDTKFKNDTCTCST